MAAFGKVAQHGEAGLYGFDHHAFGRFHEHQAIPAAVERLRRRETAGDA